MNQISTTNEASSKTTDFFIDWGLHALLKTNSQHHQEFETVLEIGSGAGEHARFFRYFNKQVYTVDLHHEADYTGDFISAEIDQQFDLLWCCHVLEHQRNIGLFLDKIYQCLKPGGLLVITVPNHPRESVISGHISSWTPHLLCYNLVLAGFDCSESAIFQEHELSLVVKKREASAADIQGTAAFNSINDLQQFFPMPVPEGTSRTDSHINWDFKYILPIPNDHAIKIQSRWLPDEGITISN